MKDYKLRDLRASHTLTACIRIVRQLTLEKYNFSSADSRKSQLLDRITQLPTGWIVPALEISDAGTRGALNIARQMFLLLTDRHISTGSCKLILFTGSGW